MKSQLHNQNKPFAGATLRKDTVDKPLADGSFIMENQQEIWKDVIGYEGYYKISNLGNVLSLDRVVSVFHSGKTHLRNVNGRILLQERRFGYRFVLFRKDGANFHFPVHRVVASHFIPNPHNKPTVNHINGIKHDNRVQNLEWATQSENNKHAYEIGIRKPFCRFGESSHFSVLKESDVIEIRKMKGTVSARLIGEKFGVTGDCILHILSGKTWKHIK